ncbi:hypothetical protein V8J88_22620 [Massilia sp. W12]|uniref:DUF6916 family protein n=1 Tax=Massilia sp. W12 TaxID=3126507 RepID=UPI0030D17F90
MELDISVQTFAAHTGSTFYAQTLAGEIPLQLIEVSPLPRGARPAYLRDPLILIFQGPDTPALLQDNYPLRHEALGEFVWCLTPIAGPIPVIAPNEKRQYQVIFN